MLIGLGLYFSFRVKFVQVRYFGEMIRLLGDGASSKTRKAQKEKSGVSSFQAFCMSTASRVGTGNLAGVAIAISAGTRRSILDVVNRGNWGCFCICREHISANL